MLAAEGRSPGASLLSDHELIYGTPSILLWGDSSLN